MGDIAKELLNSTDLKWRADLQGVKTIMSKSVAVTRLLITSLLCGGVFLSLTFFYTFQYCTNFGTKKQTMFTNYYNLMKESHCRLRFD